MSRFIDFQNEHAAQLITWFADQQQIAQWAGPGIDFTQDLEVFVKSILEPPSPSSISSFSMLSQQELIGFGQFYLRHGCAHLCRLAVSPTRRGEGVVAELVSNLTAAAHVGLSISKASLLVYPSNGSAVKAYQKLGFSIVDYPGNDDIDGCLYMQKSIF